MIAIIAAVLDKPQEVQGLKYISQLTAISSQYPKYTKYILMAFFALAGVPPMPSFWFKFYTLQEVFNSGYYITVLIILLLQLPVIYYYLQFAKNIAIGFKWFKLKGSSKPVKFTYVRSEDDEDDHIVSAYLRYMEETYTSTELFELALLFSLSLVVSGLYLVFFWVTGYGAISSVIASMASGCVAGF
jgi:NADH:ubiquinone oxidoreductase subunit 4 (subunit M)